MEHSHDAVVDAGTVGLVIFQQITIGADNGFVCEQLDVIQHVEFGAELLRLFRVWTCHIMTAKRKKRAMKKTQRKTAQPPPFKSIQKGKNSSTHFCSKDAPQEGDRRGWS